MKGFAKTRTPNMWRNVVSGRFYAVARATGKRFAVARSLKTDKETVARIRLGAAINSIRAGDPARGRSGKMNLGVCAGLYLDNVASLPRRGKMRSPGAVRYRTGSVKLLRRAWPGFDDLAPEVMTAQDCNEIMAAVLDRLKNRVGRKGSYAVTYNGALQTLRGVLEVAVDEALISVNPTRKMQHLSVPRKERHPPDRELFGRILMKLDEHPRRASAAAAVRALAFTGLRANEARNLTAADVDLAAGTLRARVTKNGLQRTIFLIPQAREIFKKDLAGTLAALKRSPKRALRTVCRDLKISALTPHDLRVLFSTRMDEAGVNMRVGAETLGHQDEGQVRRKHYIHHAPEYVRRQMQQVVV